MYFEKRVYLIVCEGLSEKAYIQELNKFLNKNGFSFTLVPYVIGSGHYRAAIKKYKSVKKDNPKQDIKIWVDKDTYIRNDQNDSLLYDSKSNNIPHFFFSLQNFEDFLAMHTDDTKLDIWSQICSKYSHHINPMQEKTYLPLFKEYLFEEYEKEQIPFEINEEKLKNLFIHNHSKSCFFKCDFASFIEKLMEIHPKVTL